MVKKTSHGIADSVEKRSGPPFKPNSLDYAPTLPETSSFWSSQNWRVAYVLLAITTVAYLPAMNAGFIWDDDSYVENNRVLRLSDGLIAIWTEPTSLPQYYPLVHTTYWLEYRLWGLDPMGYHIVNIVLHGLAAILLWKVLVHLEIPAAWFVAACFALHPVHVESVAWITERKNTLSAFFYFAAALAYLRFVDREGRPRSKRVWGYSAFVVLFLCALFAKTVTASLPAALLLIIWWKRGRISAQDLARLLPMFLLAFPLAMLTASLEKHHVGAQGAEWDWNLIERCLIAGRALWFYAGKLAFPSNLTFIYPLWHIDAQVWWQYLFPVAALIVVAFLWRFRSRVGRGPLATVLYFAGTLAPALGFFNVYPMKYSFVADHFQYLASVGLLTLFVGSFWRGLKSVKREALFVPLSAACLILLGYLTFKQCFIYQNVETLWQDTLRKNPKSEMAHTNLGIFYFNQGQIEKAMSHHRRAIALAPQEALPHNNYGQALAQSGQPLAAIEQFQLAVKLDPNFVVGRNNLGAMLTDYGDATEALAHLEAAVDREPSNSMIHYNLGRAYIRLGREEEAEASFSRAKELFERTGEKYP